VGLPLAWIGTADGTPIDIDGNPGVVVIGASIRSRVPQTRGGSARQRRPETPGA